jgi:PilZ domain
MAILHFRCKERRRTLRVMLTVPLKVHGQTVDGETFSVETHSHTVSLHGASIELAPKVVLGDLLKLENERTREKIEGKVVTIRHSRDGKTYVGVEFVDQDVNFWHMSFPVPGAKPLRRVVTEKIAAVTT